MRRFCNNIDWMEQAECDGVNVVVIPLLSALALYFFTVSLSRSLSPRIHARGSPKIEIDSSKDRNMSLSVLASTLHAVCITVLAVCVLWTLLVSFVGCGAHRAPASPASRTDAISYVTLSLSLGYFLADTWMMMVVHDRRDLQTEMVVHHAVCAVCTFVAVASGMGHVFVAWLLVSEATTPFVNARWVLDKMGLKTRSVYLYNGMALAGMWVVVRVLLFIAYFWFVYSTWENTAKIIPFEIHVGLVLAVPLVLFALNLFWFAKIVRGARKLFAYAGTRKKETRSEAEIMPLDQSPVGLQMAGACENRTRDLLQTSG